MRVEIGAMRAEAAQLLQLQYTKVEQCGSGAAACGIIDSIYQVRLVAERTNAVTAFRRDRFVAFCVLAHSLGRPVDEGQVQRQARV